jgi:hypothetical protein
MFNHPCNQNQTKKKLTSYDWFQQIFVGISHIVVSFFDHSYCNKMLLVERELVTIVNIFYRFSLGKTSVWVGWTPRT